MTETGSGAPAAAVTREAVAVFHDWASLQACVDDLLSSGFDRSEFSLLAAQKVVEEKLGHVYEKVADLEDDPEVPRTAFVGRDSHIEARAGVIGALAYVGAAAAIGVVVASGGTIRRGHCRGRRGWRFRRPARDLGDPLAGPRPGEADPVADRQGRLAALGSCARSCPRGARRCRPQPTLGGRRACPRRPPQRRAGGGSALGLPARSRSCRGRRSDGSAKAAVPGSRPGQPLPRPAALRRLNGRFRRGGRRSAGPGKAR